MAGRAEVQVALVDALALLGHRLAVEGEGGKSHGHHFGVVEADDVADAQLHQQLLDGAEVGAVLGEAFLELFVARQHRFRVVDDGGQVCWVGDDRGGNGGRGPLRVGHGPLHDQHRVVLHDPGVRLGAEALVKERQELHPVVHGGVVGAEIGLEIRHPSHNAPHSGVVHGHGVAEAASERQAEEGEVLPEGEVPLHVHHGGPA